MHLRGERAALEPFPAALRAHEGRVQRPFVVGEGLVEPAELLARLATGERDLEQRQRRRVGRQGLDRGDGAVVPRDRLLGGEHAAMSMAREHRVPRDALLVTGAAWLARISANSSSRPVVASSSHSITSPCASAPPARDALVRDVAREGVVEAQLTLAGDRGRVPLLDEALVDQALKVLLDLGAAEAFHRADPADPSNHGAVLDEPLLGRLQQVDPRGDHALDGVRQGRGQVARTGPSCVHALERSVLDHHPHQLAREERVAARPCGDLVDDVVRRLPAEQSFEQRPSLRVRQRREVDHGRVPHAGAPARTQLPQLGPGRAEQDQRAAGPRRERLDELEHGVVRPVDVLDQRDHRSPGAQRLEVPAPGARDRAAGSRRVDPGQRIRPRLDPDRREEHLARPQRALETIRRPSCARAFSRITAGGSLSRIPASALRISAIGRYGPPS